MLNEKVAVVVAADEEKVSTVNLLNHECDCGDWMSRRHVYADSSPGRACRCQVIAFGQKDVSMQIPRLEGNVKFFQLLELFTASASCFDALPTWKLLRYQGREWLAAWGGKEWCTIYTENDSGKVERYCYHLFDGRWAFGATPVGAAALRNYLASAIDGGGGDGGSATVPGK